jgi:hypothetical protein
MAAAVTLKKSLDTTQSTQIVRGTIALSGSYPAGGDTVSLSGNPVQSAKVPIVVWITEQPSASVPPSGYGLYYQPGTNPSNGKLRVTTAGSGNAGPIEFPAGAYAGTLLTAIIVFEAVFPLGQ